MSLTPEIREQLIVKFPVLENNFPEALETSFVRLHEHIQHFSEKEKKRLDAEFSNDWPAVLEALLICTHNIVLGKCCLPDAAVGYFKIMSSVIQTHDLKIFSSLPPDSEDKFNHINSVFYESALLYSSHDSNTHKSSLQIIHTIQFIAAKSDEEREKLNEGKEKLQAFFNTFFEDRERFDCCINISEFISLSICKIYDPAVYNAYRRRMQLLLEDQEEIEDQINNGFEGENFTFPLQEKIDEIEQWINNEEVSVSSITWQDVRKHIQEYRDCFKFLLKFFEIQKQTLHTQDNSFQELKEQIKKCLPNSSLASAKSLLTKIRKSITEYRNYLEANQLFID